MNICSLAMLILLLAAPWTGSQAMSFRRSNAICCYREQFIWRKVPVSKIKSYRFTPALCSRRAAIVELQKRTVCVDPELDWFQKYLKEKKSSNTSV